MKFSGIIGKIDSKQTRFAVFAFSAFHSRWSAASFFGPFLMVSWLVVVLDWWCVCFDIPGARPSRASRLSGGSLIFASGEPQFSQLEKRRAEERQASIKQKVADAITRFTGRMPFVYLHAAGKLRIGAYAPTLTPI
jgi:hypothetical protein